MICKITGVYKRPMSFFWRLVFYLLVGGNIDEIITKAEANFFLKIAPQIANTNCRIPKSYFVGKDVKQFSFKSQNQNVPTFSQDWMQEAKVPFFNMLC